MSVGTPSQDTEGPRRLPKSMTISVVICCYRMDRWDDLCAAIQSVLQQQPAIQEVIVVVDHNEVLLSRVIREFPAIQVLSNVEAKGLSGARNTGISASKSELIGFLDDDAVADAAMFARLRLRVENAEVLGAMADIQPVWQALPALWFPQEFLWVVGCTYRGLPTGRVRNLLGAAMCVRRTVFEAVGGFNSGLGRNHSALPLGCEETEFCIRANRVHPQLHFAYEASAKCLHKVPTERTTWKYFVRRCYAEGWSKAHVAFIAQSVNALASERVYATKTVPMASLRGILAFTTRGDVAGLGRAVAGGLGLSAAAVGYGVGRWTIARDPQRASALRDFQPCWRAIHER